MKTITPPLIKQVVLMLLALFIAACAKPYHLNITYDIPAKRTELPKNSIAVKIIDARKNAAIFSKKAQKEFDKWDGTFVLVDSVSVPGNVVETSDLTGLFKKALKKRLETMNIDVVDEATNGVSTLELTLEKFLLELKDRTWISNFSYEAKLSKDGSQTGKERINAQAERTKIMGRAGGERLIGEIFTEGINKLNLKKLFENAGF